MKKYVNGMPIVYNDFNGDVAVVMKAANKLILLEENETLKTLKKSEMPLSASIDDFKYKFLGFTGCELRLQDVLVPLGLMFANSVGPVVDDMKRLIRKIKSMAEIQKTGTLTLYYKSSMNSNESLTLKVRHPEIDWLYIVDDDWFDGDMQVMEWLGYLKNVIEEAGLAEEVVFKRII